VIQSLQHVGYANPLFWPLLLLLLLLLLLCAPHHAQQQQLWAAREDVGDFVKRQREALRGGHDTSRQAGRQ
jgi:hypothetical protein